MEEGIIALAGHLSRVVSRLPTLAARRRGRTGRAFLPAIGEVVAIAPSAPPAARSGMAVRAAGCCMRHFS